MWWCVLSKTQHLDGGGKRQDHQVQGHPWQWRKFRASLRYRGDPVSKDRAEERNEGGKGREEQKSVVQLLFSSLASAGNQQHEIKAELL